VPEGLISCAASNSADQSCEKLELWTVIDMVVASLAEHIVITVAVVVFHVVLLRIGGSPTSGDWSARNSERRLWRQFVGLHFLVLVVFANATLVLPRTTQRAAALIAISLIAVTHFVWRRGVKALGHEQEDAGH
jgi:TRAP-type C4-dicarboxylate transport system permease large subunit